MATYTVENELQHMNFHDSHLKEVFLKNNVLHLVFTDVIILGNEHLNQDKQRACSLNDGEDRYAYPNLTLKIIDFSVNSIIKSGWTTYDANGNVIDHHPMTEIETNRIFEILQEQASNISGFIFDLFFDNEKQCFEIDIPPYIITFTTTKTIAEFEAFGKTAWYIDNKFNN